MRTTADPRRVGVGRSRRRPSSLWSGAGCAAARGRGGAPPAGGRRRQGAGSSDRSPSPGRRTAARLRRRGRAARGVRRARARVPAGGDSTASSGHAVRRRDAGRSRCVRPSRFVNVPSFSRGGGGGQDGRPPLAPSPRSGTSLSGNDRIAALERRAPALPCGQRATPVGLAQEDQLPAPPPASALLEHLGGVAGQSARRAHAALVGARTAAASTPSGLAAQTRPLGRARPHPPAATGSVTSSTAVPPRGARPSWSKTSRRRRRRDALCSRRDEPRVPPAAGEQRASRPAARPCARAGRARPRRRPRRGRPRSRSRRLVSRSSIRRGVRGRAAPRRRSRRAGADARAAAGRPSTRGPGVRLLVCLLARGHHDHRAGAVQVDVVPDRRATVAATGPHIDGSEARRPATAARPDSGPRPPCPAKRPRSQSQPLSTSGRLRESTRSVCALAHGRPAIAADRQRPQTAGRR